jgi:hypothetical protein
MGGLLHQHVFRWSTHRCTDSRCRTTVETAPPGDLHFVATDAPRVAEVERWYFQFGDERRVLLVAG